MKNKLEQEIKELEEKNNQLKIKPLTSSRDTHWNWWRKRVITKKISGTVKENQSPFWS
ncbi:hypothetical protein [endosymbiont GvMRE of Glomus versiforme]|uniref:hypothetical protein n=1 Tax=endosymbiont GvMRE of Glomus versiforme TaxID=2039283 RepID=UPI0015594B4A|nr:hypothetical protein [endosymbiont GvMRE of Glomus versiforme]